MQKDPVGERATVVVYKYEGLRLHSGLGNLDPWEVQHRPTASSTGPTASNSTQQLAGPR